MNGTKLVAGPGDHGVTGNIYCGLHDFEDMAFVLHALRPDDLFLDIGANAGSYTVLACGAVGARGICIEPVPATFSKLLLNIRVNDLGGRVRALNVGVSDKAGVLLFSTAEDAMNHVVEGTKEGTVSVETRTLDAILGEETPAIIKLDIEGFELPALRGGSALFSRTGLQAVIMELNGSGERYGFDEKDILRMMSEFGFEPGLYVPETRRIAALATPNRKGNTLFVRDRDRLAGLCRQAPAVEIFGGTYLRPPNA
ncbi:MAG TPA: FkbM family methyltransferase [bacterium]|nr:FkbM family methyltransferase [bacterium]